MRCMGFKANTTPLHWTLFIEFSNESGQKYTVTDLASYSTPYRVSSDKIGPTQCTYPFA